MIVEDDLELGAHLRAHLSRRGFEVQSTSRGDRGLSMALQHPLDLVLLDIMLPGENGLDVLAHLRRERGTPVILMSALGAEQDRITGFSQGADDYLPKPFSLAELDARMDALLRRVALDRGANPARPKTVELALTFDPLARDVVFNGRKAGLTGSEFRLLTTLHEHAGEPLTKAFLYQQVLHRAYTRLDRGLDVHVCNLRRKLAAIQANELQIEAVRNQGYVLVCSGAA
nr:response regulator transcription factor [Pseudomonas sp. RIT-PI-AD]